MPTRREFALGLTGSAILTGCSTIGAAAGPAPSLFYLGQAKVFSVDPAAGGAKTLVDDTPKDGSRAPGVNDGIAIHGATGQIFWTNMGRAAERDGYVMRCEKDGSNVVPIVHPGDTFTPKQLKIDESAGKLYWSDREGMAIQRCNLDGTQIETLAVTGDPLADKGDETRWCVGIALDPARGHIYWTQKGGDNAVQGLIRRMNMTMPAGSTPSNRRDMITLFSRMPEPIDLDLDLATRTLYWTDRGDNTLSRAPMDPPANYDPATRMDRTILLRDLGEAIGVALDLPRRRMAWTSLEGTVGLSNLDGSGKQILLAKQGMLTGICWA
jgi:sugar lactone lactonase YvrE